MQMLLHIATGLVLFAGLSTAAVGAHGIASWAQAAGLDPVLVLGLKAVAVFLAVTDAVCIILLIGYAALTFIQDLNEERRR